MDTASTPALHCRVVSSVAWLTIDNPANMNAMTLAMWSQLADHCARLSDDAEVQVLVLCGAGTTPFCAGGDIIEFQTLRDTPEKARSYDAVGAGALAALRSFPKPTIAMVDGICLGGGLALAMNSDLRILADSTRIGITASKLGLSYDFAELDLLVKLVGPANAKMMLYTGRHYDGAQALALGLATEVHPAAALEAAVKALANEIAGNAPLSHQASKFIVEMSLADPDQRDLAACKAWEERCLASRDYHEAMQAFAAKRKPVFEGR